MNIIKGTATKSWWSLESVAAIFAGCGKTLRHNYLNNSFPAFHPKELFGN